MLVSGTNKKNIINLWSDEFAKRGVKVNIKYGIIRNYFGLAKAALISR